jgi:pimeloyl-ACP methyl ester carboxylesterase
MASTSGKNISPMGDYLVEDYVKDLGALADRLNLRNVTLPGNSAGAREM